MDDFAAWLENPYLRPLAQLPIWGNVQLVQQVGQCCPFKNRGQVGQVGQVEPAQADSEGGETD